MKKTLALSLMTLTLLAGTMVSSASAKTVASPTVRVVSTSTASAYAAQRWHRRDRERTRYVTRMMWQGRRLYRVTYRITRMCDGRTYSQIVSRVRIR